jgi:hypothetical protein
MIELLRFIIRTYFGITTCFEIHQLFQNHPFGSKTGLFRNKAMNSNKSLHSKSCLFWNSSIIIIINWSSIFRQHHYSWRLFSKKKDVILSLISISSMLMRTSCIRACWWPDYQGHLHFHTQTLLEKAIAVRLARFGFFKLDCICWESIRCQCRPHHAWPIT